MHVSPSAAYGATHAYEYGTHIVIFYIYAYRKPGPQSGADTDGSRNRQSVSELRKINENVGVGGVANDPATAEPNRTASGR